MPKSILKLICLLFVVAMSSCAKRGNITGGLKDTLAPVLKASYPKNMTTNFNGKEIKLVFDEYVKLKGINKQLIISPPMKTQPEILPYNASKIITIRFKDTLQADTTYSLNFGQSIEDNNEGNPYSQFKYVFSTGPYIDSLKINVKIKDALEKKTDNFVSVMLYEINEKFNDSTIYKETPRYITNTLDSLQIVTLENIKAGKYLLLALKDNGNNKYNPKSDKIGFQKEYITIPNDTVFEVELFKEILPFAGLKPAQAAASRMIMGYEGSPKNVKVTVKNGSETIPSIVTQFPKKDSVNIWFKPVKADSLQVIVEKEKFLKDFSVKIKKQKADSLSITSDFPNSISLRDRFSLNSSIPLIKFDKSKISIKNKDSVAVDFTAEYDEFEQKFYLDFKKSEAEKYKIQLLPGALTDFYEKASDTLTFNLSTRNLSDYGNMRVILENAKRFPIIVQLTDKDGIVKYSEYTDKETTINFDAIEAAAYTLRIIYDDNKNKVWDTGNYMERRQTEEVIYFPAEINIRANWDWEQPFNIGTN